MKAHAELAHLLRRTRATTSFKIETAKVNKEKLNAGTSESKDENNAEAAAMARLEDQSNKHMGEHDEASSASDDSSTDDEGPFLQAGHRPFLQG